VTVATAPAGAQGDAQALLAKAREALVSMSQE
jgi:tryptophanyl-tRNA synthetase